MLLYGCVRRSVANVSSIRSMIFYVKTNGNHEIPIIYLYCVSPNGLPSSNIATSMKHKHTKNFCFMLSILSCIHHNSRVDLYSLSQVFDLDKQHTQLWLHTLSGMRYIEKMNTGEYIITERGKNELIYHHVADFRNAWQAWQDIAESI